MIFRFFDVSIFRCFDVSISRFFRVFDFSIACRGSYFKEKKKILVKVRHLGPYSRGPKSGRLPWAPTIVFLRNWICWACIPVVCGLREYQNTYSISDRNTHWLSLAGTQQLEQQQLKHSSYNTAARTQELEHVSCWSTAARTCSC